MKIDPLLTKDAASWVEDAAKFWGVPLVISLALLGAKSRTALGLLFAQAAFGAVAAIIAYEVTGENWWSLATGVIATIIGPGVALALAGKAGRDLVIGALAKRLGVETPEE